jgi:SAM-dependent methyltransferase
VAGGGTGDSTVYLAEQLRGFDAEVVYLDISAASLGVARARAQSRGLTNIRWVHDSIMNLPVLGLGRFDFISCTGVLHHLESSEAGLAVLEQSLAAGGAILLMLYGKYGRRAVYDLQALLRRYLPAGAGIDEKIRLTRALLAVLPPGNGFARERDRWWREISAEGFGDAGLYDLLLHGQDRCFDVPELYALAGGAGLDLLAFIDRTAAYDPLNLLPAGPAAAERARLATLSLPERQAIAELLLGDLSAHELYLGRPGANRPATLADDGHALVLMGGLHGQHREIADGLAPGRTLTLTGRSGTLTVTGTPVVRELFRHMDAVTPVAEVCGRVAAAVPGATPESVRQELAALYGPMHVHGHVYLLRQGRYGVGVPDYRRMLPFN